MEAINYLEHYGLRRQLRPNGRYERVGPSHSWNNNTVVAQPLPVPPAAALRPPRPPGARYQALRHDDEAPQLPAGYSTMLLLAGIPPLWRRVMDPLVLAHYGGDIRLAAVHPRSEKRLFDRHARVA